MSLVEPPHFRAIGGHLGMLGESSRGTAPSSFSFARPARRPRTTLSPSPPPQHRSYLLDEGDGLPQAQFEEDPRREALRRSASGRPRDTLKDVRPTVAPSTPAPSPSSPARRTRRAQTISDDGKHATFHTDGNGGQLASTEASIEERCDRGTSSRTSSKQGRKQPSSLSPAHTAEGDGFSTQKEARNPVATPSPASSSHTRSSPAPTRTTDGTSEQRLAELRLRIRRATEGASGLQRRNTIDSPSRLDENQSDAMSARERLRERRRRRQAEQQQQSYKAGHFSSEPDHEQTTAAPSTSCSKFSRRHSTLDTSSPSGLTAAGSATSCKHATSARSTASPRGTSLSSPGPQRGRFVHCYDSSDEGEDDESPSHASVQLSQRQARFEPNPFNAVDSLTAKSTRPSSTHRSMGVPSTPSSRHARKPLENDSNRRNALQSHDGYNTIQESDGKVQIGKHDEKRLSAEAQSRRSEPSIGMRASLEGSFTHLRLEDVLLAKGKASDGDINLDAVEMGEGEAPSDDGLSTERRVARRTVSRRSASETKPAASGTDSALSRRSGSIHNFQNAQQGVKSVSVRSQARRLLRSEKGMDEAGNSPRRLPNQCPHPPPFHSSFRRSRNIPSAASHSRAPFPSFLDKACAAKVKSRTRRISEMSAQLPLTESSSQHLEQLSMYFNQDVASDGHALVGQRTSSSVNDRMPMDRQQLIDNHVGHLMAYRWQLDVDLIRDHLLRRSVLQAKRLEIEGQGVMSGCIVLVDVLDEDGRDGSRPWIKALRRLGAVATNQLPDDGFKGLFTHFVTKNGRPYRLRFFNMLPDAYKPVLVGVSWISQCYQTRRWVDEGDHLREVGREAIRALLPKPHMEEMTAENFVGPLIIPPTLEWPVPVRFVGIDLSVQPPRHRLRAGKMLLRSYSMLVFEGLSESERLGQMDLIEQLCAMEEEGGIHHQAAAQTLFPAAGQAIWEGGEGDNGDEHQDDDDGTGQGPSNDGAGQGSSNLAAQQEASVAEQQEGYVAGQENEVVAGEQEYTNTADQEDLSAAGPGTNVATEDDAAEEGYNDNLAELGNAHTLATTQWDQYDYTSTADAAAQGWQFGEGHDWMQQDPAEGTMAQQGSEEQVNQFAPAQTVQVEQPGQEPEPEAAAAVEQFDPPASTLNEPSEPVANPAGHGAPSADESEGLLIVSADGLPRLSLAGAIATNGQWYHRYSSRRPSPLRNKCIF